MKHANIKQYPSVAPDSGTEKRTAMYLLMRLFNSGVEIPATMMASHNLGFENSFKSHDCWFVFINPAIEFDN